MSDQIYNIINSSIILLAAIAGFLASFIQQKWKQKQSKIDAILEKRMKVYGEGLEFVYDVEQNRDNAEELEQIIKKWRKWYPKNSVYLPPLVNDALFGAMHWTVPMIVDLHNNDVNRETTDKFQEHLQKAKNVLMEQSQIGWLPKDLK